LPLLIESVHTKFTSSERRNTRHKRKEEKKVKEKGKRKKELRLEI
jgi:hypothetical protein